MCNCRYIGVNSKPKKKKKTTVTHYLTTELKTENLTTLDNFENC